MHKQIQNSSYSELDNENLRAGQLTSLRSNTSFNFGPICSFKTSYHYLSAYTALLPRRQPDILIQLY
jgi:hypothetical protein